MGTVIDLFTRQRVKQGRDAPELEEFVDEAAFVEEFMHIHMGDFMMEVAALDHAETIEELESQIRRIKRLVGRWPRMPKLPDQ